MPQAQPADPFAPLDTFARRHIGPTEDEQAQMLRALGLRSLDELVEQTIPADIRLKQPLELAAAGAPAGAARGERECLQELRAIAEQNQLLRSFIGQGYSGCIVPPVIQRNVLENPGWYTQYTPYQAEIAQGRLEALLNFQTMIADLTALPMANASLLDEGTAAAEAMVMAHQAAKGARRRFVVAADCHPQTIALVRARAEALELEVVVVDDARAAGVIDADVFGVLVQYPSTEGALRDESALAASVHAVGALLVVACDLLALCVLRAPGEFGADIAVGSAQRFGVPLGYGGPHAAFMATRDAFKRVMPGRLIGVSKDARGRRALRMALQTREQHIRRDKATSNICTAQVLLAVMAGMYAVYHGPRGLRAIAERVHAQARTLAAGLAQLSHRTVHARYFDTLCVETGARSAQDVLATARRLGLNLRALGAKRVGIALDETTTSADLLRVLEAFGGEAARALDLAALARSAGSLEREFARTSSYLEHPVFHSYHSEHEMLRYLRRLEARDLSLTTSMIPLGSCTMKLNATSEMLALSWPHFADLHPFAPREQARGYAELFRRLEAALREITGFAAVSLQPNAGSQGEYAGLLVIRAWHRARGEAQRRVCLIPVSAHGTNPASAVMAGMRVVPVACDAKGNVDLADLEAKAIQHRAELAALMVTYPSTHGVFEEDIRRICKLVHEHGGQVYLDGANMNAQVGLCRPGDYGADVCHLNLHKTFCIPHGGGGPGMGPIGVAAHLAPYLPGHPEVAVGGEHAIGPVSAAPWGSASILTISQIYIELMGASGLKRATEVAILGANYMAARLEPHYPVLYRGVRGRVAHEFILDLRGFEHSAGIAGEDVAKRLMDYGFHSPTMSFPVPGTLMIEPTESESLAELDRLCEALIAIRAEIRAIEQGRMSRSDNPLVNAPHTAESLLGADWSHPYTREQAAYPAAWTRVHKFWPSVSRIDNGYGDRNLICTCPPVEEWAAVEPSAPALAASRA